MFVRKKQSSASSVRQTTGSFSLKESIQNDRKGSQAAEFRDQLMVKRFRAGMYGLQTARAVHVANGRDNGAFFRADLEYLHHERNVVVLAEPVRDGF